MENVMLQHYKEKKSRLRFVKKSGHHHHHHNPVDQKKFGSPRRSLRKSSQSRGGEDGKTAKKRTRQYAKLDKQAIRPRIAKEFYVPTPGRSRHEQHQQQQQQQQQQQPSRGQRYNLQLSRQASTPLPGSSVAKASRYSTLTFCGLIQQLSNLTNKPKHKVFPGLTNSVLTNHPGLSNRFFDLKYFLLHKNFGFSEFPGLTNNAPGPNRFVKSGRHCNKK